MNKILYEIKVDGQPGRDFQLVLNVLNIEKEFNLGKL
jgi:hypothetical protein